MMLSKSNDADMVNFKLRTVLHVAVYEESLRCVQVLLNHSATVNAQVSLITTLYLDQSLTVTWSCRPDTCELEVNSCEA